MVSPRYLSVGCVVALALVTYNPTARACGGLFTETSSSEVVTMSDIRVLLVQNQGHLDQYVQVGYSGKAKSFAWVYPVAANPTVSEEKSPVFESLEKLTRPQISITTHYDSGGGGGFGCGSATNDSAENGGRQANPDVKVWQSGQVGSFEYVVITATAAKDLLDWLNNNGFAVPPSTTGVINHYLSKSWFFVAMKVAVSANNSEVPATTTVKLSYDTSEVVYPLKMVSLSPSPKTSFEFYLATSFSAEELSPRAPYSAMSLPASRVVALSSTDHNYSKVLVDTEDKAGKRGLVRVYSSSAWNPADLGLNLPYGSTLTRMQGTFSPEEMDMDIAFDRTARAHVSSSYQLTYAPDEGSQVPWLVLLLAIGWRLRKPLSRRP